MSGPEKPPSGGGSRDGLDERQVRQIAMVGGLVLVVSLVLVFIVENSRQVRVSFVFFSSDISLIWVIVLSAIAGAVLGAVLTRLVRRRFLDRD
jgi:uncharacterized integral membrane protein